APARTAVTRRSITSARPIRCRVWTAKERGCAVAESAAGSPLAAASRSPGSWTAEERRYAILALRMGAEQFDSTASMLIRHAKVIEGANAGAQILFRQAREARKL